MTEKNFENEEWRAVKGYEEFYAVSSLGRVKSIERTVTSKNRYGVCQMTVKERILKPSLNKDKGEDGYLTVGLSKNGKAKTFGVHVLVALSFPEICGLPFEGAEVNHIDENHFNNVPENLNWLSHPDNCNHGTGIERRAKAQSKAVLQFTKKNTFIAVYPSLTELYKEKGYAPTAISNCCNGRQKTAYGYKWYYKSEFC